MCMLILLSHLLPTTPANTMSAGIPVLNELGMQQLHHLCVNSTTKTFPKGAVIHEADFADWMLCVVLRGRVTIHPMQKDREPSPSVKRCSRSRRSHKEKIEGSIRES